jgi:hypothetical protein
MPDGILDRLGRGGRPNAAGEVSHNRGEWRGAMHQRGAALDFLAAIARADRRRAEDAWRAFDLAFAHLGPDGGFDVRNDKGKPSPAKDVASDAAFFLAQFCQAVFVVRASSMAPDFEPRAAAFVAKLPPVATMMLADKDLLVPRDGLTANRYFIDGLAFGFLGLLVPDESAALAAASSYFVDLALKMQHAEGFFEEAGGADTSYNGVSSLMLGVYDLYFPGERLDEALAGAVAWETAHVGADGEIDKAGNTRTGSGQEHYFGKAKEINYPEVIMGLLYNAGRADDADWRRAAERAFAFKYVKDHAGDGD